MIRILLKNLEFLINGLIQVDRTRVCISSGTLFGSYLEFTEGNICVCLYSCWYFLLYSSIVVYTAASVRAP